MQHGTQGIGLKDRSFQSLKIESAYIGKGNLILKDFLLPVLLSSVSYDRVTSFFTVDSLLAISQGIESIYRCRGHMRLIIGLHSCPREIAEIQLNKKVLEKKVSKIREDLEAGIRTISDTFVQERLATILWMIEDGLLSVKVASVQDGIFHPKTLIFTDAKGDRLVAVGSSNETPNGLGGNYEQLLVLKSWESPSGVSTHEFFFNQLWNDELNDVSVFEITDQVASMVLNTLPKNQLTRRGCVGNAFSIARKMPSNFFVSGLIPSLYPHQERAVLDALSRWPVRVLFCDEVGLGKTFESAATMTFLMRFCGVKNVVLLTPKSVLRQWQNELHDHFGIDAWRFDSTRKSYIGVNGDVQSITSEGPLSTSTPDVKIISAQYARGTAGASIFDSPDCVLPDLLILDEAHSARISLDISGGRKATQINRMMMAFSQKIPHIILATATPMQKDAEEYHSLLKILGLPKSWQKPSHYLASLNLISGNSSVEERQVAFDAGRMLKAVLTYFKPDLSGFSLSQKRRLLALSNCSSPEEIVDSIQAGWKELHEVFVRLHPAHLLTVRNTRDVLSQFGYRFPIRKLFAEEVNQTMEIKRFYSRVEDFLTSSCFSVEKTLNPEKKTNIGFLKVNYRQRISSSLRSCALSLRRRVEKLKEIKNATGIGEKLLLQINRPNSDSLDDDDMLSRGIEIGEEIILESPDKLEKAVMAEISALAPLVETAEQLAKVSDPKIDRALELVIDKLREHNQVLIFSRYTDTIDSFLHAVKKSSLPRQHDFAIYTGKEASIYVNGSRVGSSKEEIQEQLKAKRIDFVLCSDAASEGLNLQMARVLVNIDVPWTPSRLEQRIGRVARLGQKADSVEIYNIWYPNSIEARMYRRIESRLGEARLAVGDFPDVLADSIRNQLINDYDDEETIDNELSQIRQDCQYDALKRIWSVERPEQTWSGNLREKLLSLCKHRLPYRIDNGNYVFSNQSGDCCRVNSLAGDACAISYSSRCLQWFPSSLEGFTVAEGRNGTPQCFQKSNDVSYYVDFSDIPDAISGSSVQTEPIAYHPRLLPNIEKLSTGFILEEPVPDAPDLWDKT